ncbi:GTP-dependent dephospho-CoA kinase family protein [Methanobrevibacter filiformis]|uniref:GTP-dependent dephospho-CoA kinase n=1 Tax=Methanobrevibacter filiformis TaxID=55758 RepID=A0A165ZGG2_9EURY|nr:DUF359 domain-containing protein [Methanobrevibacter filiformis]KZX10679.1 hypothetical protein MBFIL_16700 [Methanobrevibacter filiformis]
MGFLINEELRNILKIPLGELFPIFDDAVNIIKDADFLISVGDATTKNLLESKIFPNLAIIDNRIQREEHDFEFFHAENILTVNNAPGTITDALWETIKTAISYANNEYQLIVVKGEEDLAVLPCILLAPENSVILYGQPNEGLVLVNSTDLKDVAKSYMDKFDEL